MHTVPADDLDTATIVTACKNRPITPATIPRHDLQTVKAAITFNSFNAAVGCIQGQERGLSDDQWRSCTWKPAEAPTERA